MVSCSGNRNAIINHYFISIITSVSIFANENRSQGLQALRSYGKLENRCFLNLSIGRNARLAESIATLRIKSLIKISTAGTNNTARNSYVPKTSEIAIIRAR